MQCSMYDGGIPLGLNPAHGLAADGCTQLCDQDAACDCVSFGWYSQSDADDGGASNCWKFARCQPALFANNTGTLNFTVYAKKVPPKPAPNPAAGALAYLKHDSMGPRGDAAIMVFNPGKAQTVTVDLSMLPPSVFGAIPVDLFADTNSSNAPPPLPPLAKMWSVKMGAGDVKAFAGFTLGVFAPRRGKKTGCRADDHYSKSAGADTLQGCFLECLNDLKCENVYVDFIEVVWLEKPPPARCMLLGALKDPSSACKPGNGTLIAKLTGGRRLPKSG